MANIEELIANCKLTNSTTLSLYNVESPIIELPEEIFELTNLEELSIGNTQIRILPDKLLNLQKLKVLHVSGDFEKFPIFLKEFPDLTELQFHSDSIESLPQELDSWKKLDYLYIGGCTNLKKVNGIPQNLSYIHIGETALTEIPKKIFSINSLLKIVATNLNLNCLPYELYDMKNLLSLFIGNNNIHEFPKEILRLENLEELLIESNNLYELPEILTNIQSLNILLLRRNCLSDLPKSIVNLKNLKQLDLGNNYFTNIPKIIYEIENLEELSFGNYYSYINNEIQENNITEISQEILKLKNLNVLDLFRNPVSNIPPEILQQNFEGIKNYLLSKLESVKDEYLYEAKMVIVGRGNVGKTVLRRKLTEPNYSLTESKSTLGIDILKESFNLKVEGLENTDYFKFNIWDFGGQEKYDATHQLFITNRSIYLFLTEAREESNYLDFYHWLNTIRIFAGNTPIIVVLSKADERKKHLPASVYREKFENIIDFVEISCADGYEDTIESLKKSINNAVKLLPQITQKLSNKWIDIRNDLEKLSENTDYISYEEYLKVCNYHNLNKKRGDFLSLYLNDLGVIIHHQNDLLLRKTVFLSTDWCVDGMYKVLDNQKIVDNNGFFTILDLNEIWGDERFVNKQEELLKLMRAYQLCFELKDGSGFISPELLPHDRPPSYYWDDNNNLQFEIRYDFMPAGMLSRFIVKSHSFIKENIYWKYGVILEYDGTLGLVEEDYINNKIKIRLVGENKKGLLAAIRMNIDEVHRDFDKNNKLVLDEMVPCNCSECQISEIPHFYRYSVLRKFEQKAKDTVPCEKSGDDVPIKQLINDVQVPDQSMHFITNIDLRNFIISLMNTILVHDIQMKGGYSNFWRDQNCTDPKNEIEFQSYICSVLDNYCKVRGIQLSREVKEANGSVDILFTYTSKDIEILKVCVEIKKAHHQDVTTAIKTQLPKYMESAGASAGIYLVIWFKNKKFREPKKIETQEDLLKQINLNIPKTNKIIVPIVIDCTKKPNPSKIKI